MDRSSQEVDPARRHLPRGGAITAATMAEQQCSVPSCIFSRKVIGKPNFSHGRCQPYQPAHLDSHYCQLSSLSDVPLSVARGIP